MKKLIMCLIIVLNFSCEQKTTVIVSEYPKQFKLYTEGLKTGADGIVMGSDNHEYLITDFQQHRQNTEHYVECKLCKSRDSIK